MFQNTPVLKQEPEIFNCSIGMNAVLNTFVNLNRSARRPIWDTLIVNFATLLRNNWDNERSVGDIMRGVENDVDMLVDFWKTYISDPSHSIAPADNPYVLLYHPRYMIPKLHERQFPPSQLKYHELCRSTWDTFIKDNDKTEMGLPIYQRLVGKRNYPHKELDSIVHECNKTCTRKTNRRYLMFSHMPVDFHFGADKQDRFQVIESYTGDIKLYIELGFKVFKIAGIPFNRTTHILFGDKVLIKGVLNTKDRKLAKEMAVKSRWNFKSESSIRSEVSARLSIDNSILTTLKF